MAATNTDEAMDRLLHDLAERQARRDMRRGEGAPDAPGVTELEEELRTARAMLASARQELQHERERHDQTKELLRMALRPAQTPDRPNTRPPPSAGRQASSSPKRSPGKSAPLNDLLSKATATTTPRAARTKTPAGGTTPRTTTPNQSSRLRTMSPASSSRKPNNASGMVFGSRTPRFVDISLSGDHCLIRSRRDEEYYDEDIARPAAPQNTPMTAKKRTTPGASPTPRSNQRVPQGYSPGPSYAAASRISAADQHTLRSPDVQMWAQEVRYSPSPEATGGRAGHWQ